MGVTYGARFLARFVRSGQEDKPATADRYAREAIRIFQVLGIVMALIHFGRMFKNVDNWPVEVVHTRAGTVKVDRDDISKDIYKYVEANTQPGEYLADFSYGQGMCFAGHLKSPLFSTQFSLLCPADWMRQKDLEGLEQHPPRFVLFDEPKRIFFGTNERVIRHFPYLVWLPSEIFRDDSVPFPAEDYVLSRYALLRTYRRNPERADLQDKFDKTLYVPKEQLSQFSTN